MYGTRLHVLCVFLLSCMALGYMAIVFLQSCMALAYTSIVNCFLMCFLAVMYGTWLLGMLCTLGNTAMKSTPCEMLSLSLNVMLGNAVAKSIYGKALSMLCTLNAHVL